MKKRIIANLFFIFLLIFNINVYGKSNSEIDRFNSNLLITKEGNAQVKESITWSQNSSRNVVTRTIDKKNTSKIDDIKVYINGKSLTQDTMATNGSKDVYNIVENNNSLEIKVYTSFPSSKTIDFTYVLKDLTSLGQDTGDLSYGYFKGLKDNIRNFKSTIEFEYGAYTGKDVFIRSSGDVKSEVKDGKIVLTGTNIPKDSSVNVEVLYDMDFTEFAKNRTDSTYKDLALSAKENPNKKSPIIYTVIAIGFGVLLIPFGYKLLKLITATDDEENLVYLTAVEAGYFLKGNMALTRLMEVTLLEMEEAGAISIYRTNYTTKRGKTRADYVVVKEDESQIKNSYQRYFFDKLFELNGSDEISFKEIRDIRSENEVKFYRNFEDFVNILKERLIELGLKYQNLRDVKLFSKSAIISVLFLLSSFFTLNPIIILIATLAFIAILVVGFAVMFRLTPKGEYVFKKYKKIENDLKDNRDSEDTNGMFHYGVAFGFGFEDLMTYKVDYPFYSFNYELLSSAEDYKSFTEAFNIATTGSSTGGSVHR